MPPEDQQFPSIQPTPGSGENIVPQPTPPLPPQPQFSPPPQPPMPEPQVITPQFDPVPPAPAAAPSAAMPPAPEMPAAVVSPTAAPAFPPAPEVPSFQPGIVTPTATPMPAIPPAPADPMQPMAPQPFVGGPAAPAPLPTFSPNPPMSGSSSSLKKLLIIIGGVVGVLVIALLVFMLAFNKNITATDVSNAQDASEAIFNDVEESSAALTESALATSGDEVKSKLDLANTKLADAQKKYQTLSKSAVLNDKTVKSKFKALDAKWKPYIDFETNGVHDDQALMPAIISFTDKTDQISQSTPSSTAQLSEYLSQLKAVTDSTKSQLASVKVTLSENQQLLQDLNAYLDSFLSAIGKAQSDLAGGKDLFSVSDDLFSVDDATTKFEGQVGSISSQLDDKEKKLSPSNELTAYETALDQLSIKVGTNK